MKHGSLFSGIGGFDLAAQWCGWKNIFQVEINDFCQRVLAKNFPTVKRYKDIKEFDGTEYKGTIDIISGGFPCQPFSFAGKRKGTEDDRSLWHEMFRIIKEIEPDWIVGENVTGIVNMELDNIIFDLETESYETQTFIIPACAVNAPHKRDRIWIIANANNERLAVGKSIGENNGTKCETIERNNWWAIESGVDRVVNGVSCRVDRLKSLGNAIIPQIAYEIFKAIDILTINKENF